MCRDRKLWGRPKNDGIHRDTVRLKEYIDNSRAHTYPVAQKEPNDLGIYDMSGNVTEWTADRYAPYTAERKKDPQSMTESKKDPQSTAERKKDPQGTAESNEYVYRGGGWYFGPWAARVSQRSSAPSKAHFSNVGFRLAMPKHYKM